MLGNATILAGIDFGSQLAGTTVIAFLEDKGLSFLQSAKKKPADDFILEWVEKKRPGLIGIDAPLSLPGVYRFEEGYQDYHFREADRLLSAMSPLFLGGLTARAMQLKALLSSRFAVQVVEVYPAHLIKILNVPAAHYKSSLLEIKNVAAHLQTISPFTFHQEQLLSWHHIDALLALWSTWRFQQGSSLHFGNREEGLIIV